MLFALKPDCYILDPGSPSIFFGALMTRDLWCHIQKGSSDETVRSVTSALAGAGLAISAASSGATGQGIVLFHTVDEELCEMIRRRSNSGAERVIGISRPGCESGAFWRLLASGASDVVRWDNPSQVAADVVHRFERWREVDLLLDSPCFDELIGTSRPWRNAMRQVVEAARFSDACMLITGESGTGKEQVARVVHALDARKGKRDFIVVDCTTIIPGLSGSEFFGHERGAFTGAAAARDGAFALADGGTMFLDEVGELPLELQAQLLRVVQEKCYKRVGGNTWQRTEFRLVCATNRDLAEEVKRGVFRHDLYYRITGCNCRLPSLAERRGDIIPLARHFMNSFPGYRHPPALDKSVEEYLLTRDYPGNVRDLKQLVGRIMYRHVGRGPITAGDIPLNERPAPDVACFCWCGDAFEEALRAAVERGVGLKEIGRTAENRAVDLALDAEGGNVQRAARRLGVTDRALQLRRAARQNGGPNGQGNGINSVPYP